jgi:septal ring factor EnvC (AmiA/AmiB activator)
LRERESELDVIHTELKEQDALNQQQGQQLLILQQEIGDIQNEISDRDREKVALNESVNVSKRENTYIVKEKEQILITLESKRQELSVSIIYHTKLTNPAI